MPKKQKKKATFKKRKKQSTDFVHFGCWNQGLCDMVEKNNPLSNVMFTLNEYVKHIDIDFITVAGDNYYPNKIKIGKDKKIKRIYDKNLKSGFDCLPNGKEIYMLLGNHDLETNLEKNPNIFIEDTDTLEENCYILSKELEYSDSHKPPIKFVFNQSKLIDKTLILMIDTSLYSKTPEEYLQCYNNLLSKNLKSIGDIIKIQSMFVLNSIKKNMGRFRNLVLIGHHPITGNKVKNGLKLIKPFKGFIDLFVDIYNILGDTVNYNYLCADLHLHQEGYVRINDMVINQYIVGTGGTKLDDNSKVFQERTITTVGGHKIVYDMTLSDKVYGFLHCSARDGKFNCAFVNTLQKGGRKNKVGGMTDEVRQYWEEISRQNPDLIRGILALDEKKPSDLVEIVRTPENYNSWAQLKELDTGNTYPPYEQAKAEAEAQLQPQPGTFLGDRIAAVKQTYANFKQSPPAPNLTMALPFFGIRFYESRDKGIYDRDVLSNIQTVSRENIQINQCVPAQIDALSKIVKGEQYMNADEFNTVDCPLLGSQYYTSGPTPMQITEMMNGHLIEIGENCIGPPQTKFFRWDAQKSMYYSNNFPLILSMNLRDTFAKPLFEKYGNDTTNIDKLEYVFIPILYDIGQGQNSKQAHAMNIIIDLSYLKQQKNMDFWNVSIDTLPQDQYNNFIIECSRYITIFDTTHWKSSISSWYEREIQTQLNSIGPDVYMVLEYYPLISPGGIEGCIAHNLNIAGGSKKRTKKKKYK